MNGGRHSTALRPSRLCFVSTVCSPGNEHRHWFALGGGHIIDSGSDVILIPKPASASVSCPASLPAAVNATAVQCPAGIGLEGVHHYLGARISFDHRVHMRAPHVSGVQSPTTVAAHLQQRFEHDFSLLLGDDIGRLAQMSPFNECAVSVRIRQAAPICVMQPVNRSLLVSMEMIPVARKCSEISHDACK